MPSVPTLLAFALALALAFAYEKHISCYTHKWVKLTFALALALALASFASFIGALGRNLRQPTVNNNPV